MPSLPFQRAMYQVVRILPRHELTRLAGRAARLPVTPKLRPFVYGTFARVVGAQPAEAAEPLDAFATFDAFFTRALRTGARPAPQPHAIASPADGKLAAHGTIDAGTLVQAKGIDYTVAELLGGDEHAAAFATGRFATVYLSPADYHRVHAPAGCRFVHLRHLGGELWPVNGFSVPFVRGLFAVNERFVAVGALDDGTPFAMVMVAATVVGGMSVRHPDVTLSDAHRAADATWNLTTAWQLAAGDEFGTFHIGSTVVMLVGGDAERWQFVPPAAASGAVRLGETLLERTAG